MPTPTRCPASTRAVCLKRCTRPRSTCCRAWSRPAPASLSAPSRLTTCRTSCRTACTLTRRMLCASAWTGPAGAGTSWRPVCHSAPPRL
uniref:Alternative protein n=1 Tax=Macrostomum lignano TaxID=282301 RepID=A0A1I8IPE2_9PLAT